MFCFRLSSSWTVPSTWWGVCLPSRSRRTSVTSSTWWVAVDILPHLSVLSKKLTTTLGHCRNLFMGTLGKWPGSFKTQMSLSCRGRLALTSLIPQTSFDLHVDVHFMFSLQTGETEWNLLFAEIVEPLFPGDHWLCGSCYDFFFLFSSLYLACSMSFSLTHTPACWAHTVLTITSEPRRVHHKFHPQNFILCCLTTERLFATFSVQLSFVNSVIIVCIRAVKGNAQTAAPTKVVHESQSSFPNNLLYFSVQSPAEQNLLPSRHLC